MGNILRVLARDLKRLAKAPAAWIVCLFLIVLPSFYAWINVYGFWDPYDNTANLRVCVVNQDEGCDDGTLGELDLGSQITDALHGNDQLGWTFVDYDEAMRQVSSGEAYAAYVIPRTFSSDIATLLSGDLEQAKIEYLVNEKTGPVAPRITDAGATALDNQVNSAFVSQVAATVSAALDREGAAVRDKAHAATSRASAQVGDAAATVEKACSTVAGLDRATEDARAKSEKARASLAKGKKALGELSDELEEASDLVKQANLSASRIAVSLGSAFDSSSAALSLSLVQANAAIGNAAATVSSAKADVDGAARNLEAIVAQQEQVVAQMQSMAQALPAGEAKDALLESISSLAGATGEARQLLDDLTALAADIDDTTTAIAGASDSLNSATQSALGIAGGYRAQLGDDTLPAVSAGIASLADAISRLSGNLGSQRAVVGQADATLGQLGTVLAQSSKALGHTDGLLADSASELRSLQADLASLGAGDLLGSLDDLHIDSKRVANFMLSPTQVKTEQLYPLDSYGSAMAPLFINLTLWIGVFMLMVIMRIEVDREGIESYTVAQRYLGRQAFLGLMCIAQAVVCCAGCLAIGVQVASVPLFILTTVIASLSYLAIQYSLSSTFQHVGKALCLILVFVQIPGATGLYPIEMTTDFFRASYPIFPFTYGINAIRETSFGFYGNLWANDILVLLGFLVAFTLIGTLGRPFTANLNRMFERKIRETDIINIEPVELAERRYKISQLLDVLYSRDEFRAQINVRLRKFLRAYPHLKRTATFAGIGVPVIATPLMMMGGVDKVIILTIWLVWLILIIVAMIVLEFVLDNMRHQLSLADVSPEEIDEFFSAGGDAATGRRTRRVVDRRGRMQRDPAGGAPDAPVSAGKHAAATAAGDDGRRDGGPRHAAPGERGEVER